MSHALNGAAGPTAEEKRALAARLLREKAAASRAGETRAHRLFEAQVARSPESVAIAHEGRELTYRDLNVEANRLAHHLRSLGVGPETLVGLCLGRSIEMVAGLLGVLKAGGAYVPLDPTYPPERLAYMVEDSRASVLLTRGGPPGGFAPTAARIVCVDRDRPAIAAASDRDPAGGPAPENLAYVIYTSGSTGRPKGAMIPHRGLSNYLAWAARAYEVAEGTGAPVHSSLSFDLTITGLLAPLVVGRRVDLVGEGPGIEALAEALRRGSNYSLVKLTPAHLQLLGERLEPREMAGRTRAFVVGGEQLTAEQVAPWMEHAPETVLINEYGPTETVVGCCVYRVPRDQPPTGAVPIGRPIANTQLYVLDAHLRPVPVGVPGELYIGGAGVARGYLGRPALTAERFPPNPFAEVPGARMYRTGDLARWRPDRNIEFLGRIDDQVKIRGYRVELGEVEAALDRHPSVRQAVVVAREDLPGDRRLVAYLVPGGAPPGGPELRDWLQTTLPEYMIPSAFVVLDSLPLTPNGKVDRKALPPPDRVHLAPADAYVPPRGPVEEALAGIWGELLGRDRVGIYDNFFDLGGHSLIATRLVARVRDTFSVEPSLRDFLDEPTVAGLSRLVERDLTTGAGLLAPPIEPARRDGPPPASFAQERLWFLDQLEPGGTSYNVPVAVRLVGDLDVTALERALNEVVRRHEALRTTFDSAGGVPRQVVAPSLTLTLSMLDLSALPERDREAEAMRRLAGEACRPFDLARGPLVRAGLVRLGDRDHIAHVMLHHIVADGWSMGVLTREVQAIYDAFHRGEPSPLQEPPLQYGDYSAWQRAWLQGEALQAQLNYWTGHLSGVTTLELPADRPRPPSSSGRGGERSIVLPRSLAEELRSIGRKEGATLFMTLLAAFEVLLQRYSGQSDIAVGTPIAGRTRSELENLIGLFINTLVLRSDLSGDPDFRECIRRVRQVALGAYAHQDLPFERLVNALHPERDPGRTPLFQVMFAMQNAPLPPLSSPEIELIPIDLTSGAAKFDLTLIVSETERGLEASMEYSVDLFDPSTIDRMLGHFRILLEGIAADPGQSIGSLPMLTEEERRLLTCPWGDPGEENSGSGLADLSETELDALLQDLSVEGDAADE